MLIGRMPQMKTNASAAHQYHPKQWQHVQHQGSVVQQYRSLIPSAAAGGGEEEEEEEAGSSHISARGYAKRPSFWS